VVYPSELEKHLGEVWNPALHQEDIAAANLLLSRFAKDLGNGEILLVEIGRAAEMLGTCAGYPSEVVRVIGFLESPAAAASYRQTADLICEYTIRMNRLIEQRIEVARALSAGSTVGETAAPSGSPELPF
jgi:hypothetical protein